MSTDGKKYQTEVANTEGIFRIIQSIPSSKAEPFKRWLAKVGYERAFPTGVGMNRNKRETREKRESDRTGMGMSQSVVVISYEGQNKSIVKTRHPGLTIRPPV